MQMLNIIAKGGTGKPTTAVNLVTVADGLNKSAAGASDPSGERPCSVAEGDRQSMRIVTAIGKGGSGKSSLLANLATLAASRGMPVAVIDADPQASLCQWRGTRGKSTIKVVPCGEVDDLAIKVEDARRAGILRLMIDTSPALGTHTMTAISLAHLVLVPTRPTSFDVFVARRRIELLNTMNREFACVINAAPARRAGIEAPFVRQTRDSLRGAGAHPWVGQITHRHSIVQAMIDGKGVIEAEPEGLAAREFVWLWDDMERHASTCNQRRHP